MTTDAHTPEIARRTPDLPEGHGHSSAASNPGLQGSQPYLQGSWQPPTQIANAARRAASEISHLKSEISSPGAANDPARLVAAANRYRDQLNPLRGLTMTTAVAWLDEVLRGQFANFAWASSFIERRDPDLLAIVERRTGMLRAMDWDAKTVERRFRQRGLAFDANLAAEQQAMLRGVYDGFSNLYDAIAALEMAAFHGYALVQFLAEGEPLRELNILQPWHVARDGIHGDWYFNPDALATDAKHLGDDNRLNLGAYVLRTHARPINEFGLVKFLRDNLSAKDWDAFIEIYGLPGWIVILPPNVPEGKVAEYTAAATSVASGGSGALPNGSDAKCADAPRGVAPFQAHLDYWSQRLVLAGTGGLLTMLAAPGSGTLAGSAHWEAFQIVARAEARIIAEVLQKSVDRYFLNLHFPGRPALAYFDLAATEEKDPGQILEHALKIVQAGGQPDWTQIAEKTGYRITAAPAAPAPAPFAPPLRNAAPLSEISNLKSQISPSPLVATAAPELAAAQANDFAALAARLDAALKLPRDEMLAALAALDADLPDLAARLLADPAQAPVLEQTLAAALADGYAAAAARRAAPPPEGKEA